MRHPTSGASPPAPAGSRLASAALIVVGLALGLLFFFSDLRKLWDTAAQLRPGCLSLSVACAFGSYLTMARCYQGIAAAAGAPIGFGEMLRITVVANTINYLVSTGGLSGFAMRAYFLVRRGVSSGNAVVISLVQTFVTNVTLLLCLSVGFWHMVSQRDLNPVALTAAMALLAVSGLASVAALVLVVQRDWRRRGLYLLCEGLVYFVRRYLPRRKIERVRLWRFQHKLHRGIDFLLQRKRHMVAPTLWIVIDWVVTIGILHTAFWAVGVEVPVAVVMVGFSVGVVLSIVSLIPGGLGVMETSMAAIFTSFGVPLEAAVIAVLVFRIAYYVLPALVSVFFFRGMLLEGAAQGLEASRVGSADAPGNRAI